MMVLLAVSLELPAVLLDEGEVGKGFEGVLIFDRGGGKEAPGRAQLVHAIGIGEFARGILGQAQVNQGGLVCLPGFLQRLQ